MKNKFYEKCARLRNFYTLTPTQNDQELQLLLLSKLIGISFYDPNTQKGFDDLPICQEFVIDCTNVQSTYSEIEAVLKTIFEDLDNYHFSINPVEPFKLTHRVSFKLL